MTHSHYSLMPLSDVLELIRVRGNTVFTCAAEPPFGIRFPAGKHRLHIIRSGSVAISVEGLDDCVPCLAR